jgi:hypothetical protein
MAHFRGRTAFFLAAASPHADRLDLLPCNTKAQGRQVSPDYF